VAPAPARVHWVATTARGAPATSRALCVCHTARHRLWGVQLVRKGWRRVREEGRARRDTMCRRRWTTAYAAPHGCVGVRWLRLVGARALEPKRDARRGASLRGGGGVFPVRAGRSTGAAGGVGGFWCALRDVPRPAPNTLPSLLTERPRGATSARAHLLAGARARGPEAAPSPGGHERSVPLAPHDVPLTTHAVQPPAAAVGGQAPTLHTVRRTWCSTSHHHHGGGPASRATAPTRRGARGGSRRRGHERWRAPRGRGRVLHTMCPTQRRNQRLAC